MVWIRDVMSVTSRLIRPAQWPWRQMMFYNKVEQIYHKGNDVATSRLLEDDA